MEADYMKLKRVFAATMVMSLMLSGCGQSAQTETQDASAVDSQAVQTDEAVVSTSLAQVDMTKWQYNEDTDAYWQVGIVYCENPADSGYENLGIFVPGAYMNGTANGDGTYTCEVNESADVGGYTAATAPIVIPVETPGYSAMAAPTDYVSDTDVYTDAGFVYVYAGARGRDAGAPAGVIDLKAAIRYIRYNESVIPGNMDRIFSFGMSGGGAQSALVGAIGDSELYTPYLEAIGAVSGVSDAVCGSMCWCPITNLDTADEAYEWNLGVSRTGLSEDMQQLSDDMAAAYADYINALGLKSEDGTVLTLEASDDGIYQAGTYYEYIKGVVETSLNNFLADTEFPYTVSSSAGFGAGGFGGGNFGGEGDGDFGGPGGEGFGGFGGPDGEAGEREFRGMDGNMPEGGFGSGNFGGRGDNADNTEENDYYAADGIDRNETSGGVSISGTYETVEDYIAALNADTQWVSYDASTNTATITSVADFVKALKNASKSLGAFDSLDESQGENVLFGYGDGEGAHFDAILAELLKGTDYESAYAEDLAREDALGNTVDYRLNMYTPLYYISDYYDGYQTANTAHYWRIRTGINQSDTALSTEVNLALMLEAYGADVDFATVWGQGHVKAERTGDSDTNFIEWVNECLK